MVVSRENGVNCPKCRHSFEVPADRHLDPRHLKQCPDCGHSWSSPWSFTEGQQAGDENGKWIGEAIDAAVGDSQFSKAEMFELLRDEARISTELRTRSVDRPVADVTRPETKTTNTDPVSINRNNLRRFPVLWVLAATLLILSYAFNDLLAELIPVMAPVLEGYHDLVGRLFYDLGRLVIWVRGLV